MLSRTVSKITRQVRLCSTSNSLCEDDNSYKVMALTGLGMGAAFGAYQAFIEMPKESEEYKKFFIATIYPLAGSLFGAGMGLGARVLYPYLVGGVIIYGSYKVGEYIEKK